MARRSYPPLPSHTGLGVLPVSSTIVSLLVTRVDTGPARKQPGIFKQRNALRSSHQPRPLGTAILSAGVRGTVPSDDPGRASSSRLPDRCSQGARERQELLRESRGAPPSSTASSAMRLVVPVVFVCVRACLRASHVGERACLFFSSRTCEKQLAPRPVRSIAPVRGRAIAKLTPHRHPKCNAQARRRADLFFFRCATSLRLFAAAVDILLEVLFVVFGFFPRCASAFALQSSTDLRLLSITSCQLCPPPTWNLLRPPTTRPAVGLLDCSGTENVCSTTLVPAEEGVLRRLRGSTRDHGGAKAGQGTCVGV